MEQQIVSTQATERNIHETINPELVGISEDLMKVQLVAKMLREVAMDEEDRHAAAGILDDAWKAITEHMQAIEALTLAK